MKLIALGIALGIAVVAVQCREGSPTGDPKTPPNTPIPDIDQRERDPKGPTVPSLFDAG